MKYLIFGMIGGLVIAAMASTVEQIFGISYWLAWPPLYIIYVILGYWFIVIKKVNEGVKIFRGPT